MGEKVQGIRSIVIRQRIGTGRLRTMYEMEKPRTYIYDPWT